MSPQSVGLFDVPVLSSPANQSPDLVVVKFDEGGMWRIKQKYRANLAWRHRQILSGIKGVA